MSLNGILSFSKPTLGAFASSGFSFIRHIVRGSVFFFVRWFAGRFDGADGQTHAAAKLGLKCGLVRHGNVCGCEGLRLVPKKFKGKRINPVIGLPYFFSPEMTLLFLSILV